MTDLFQTAYDQLLTWCRDRDFAGHDPFDALNSTVFQATPLANSRNARFIWTQLIKRSPIDLRPLIRVPAERNAKAIALFALALKNCEAEAQSLLADLLNLKIDGFSGAAWGYNFDWQSRNFFAPRGTPTIVPTAFAARAFVEHGFLETARSVCEFILRDLPRPVDTPTEICFSYTPNDNTQIFNASLLAAEVLASVGKLTGETELYDVAMRAARYVVNHQRDDGSWSYGTEPTQSWIDNFHTAYILFSLKRIIDACPGVGEFQSSLEQGFSYWKSNFFLAEGWPKYYHDDPYPADAHAAASAIVTLVECRELDETSLKTAQDIARWTIQNLRDERGFFYYQRRRFYTIRKPYMRWTQGWMLYALARLLEAERLENARLETHARSI
ncbi:MAG TPA: hypothetical protein VHQ94_18070 [Pyrinomonadaceae bacterium]|nr:hypothetical protein [Pyrinomonadaceae bacterium]